MDRRTRVLMVCAHEPSLDPRIRWEAEAAADDFDVTVLGFNRADGSAKEVEACGGYKIVRLPHRETGALFYFWRLSEIVPYRIRFLVVVLTVGPLLVLAELLGRIARKVLRDTVRTIRKSGALSSIVSAHPAKVTAVRGLLLARVHFILSVLRVQFAPATRIFWNYLRKMPEKPEVVHCNDLDTLLVGVLAKRAWRCRIVFDAHEFYPRSDPSGRWIDIAFFSKIEQLLVREADAVVTVNPPLADAIRTAYGLREVHAVANAEPWAGEPDRPRFSEMGRLAGGRCKFLFQGRFTPGRGIEELLQGWRDVDGERAALFLRGPDNMWRQGAIALAAELGLLDRSVYFLDAVTEDELVGAAAEADVGIIPYRPLIINDRLSCPNKLSQYLHAGLMVVANNLTFVKSVLTEAEAGLFYDSARIETLAAAVNRILDDPALLKRCQENAVRYARERFNWQVEGKKLYALYERPAGEAARERVAAGEPKSL